MFGYYKNPRPTYYEKQNYSSMENTVTLNLDTYNYLRDIKEALDNGKMLKAELDYGFHKYTIHSKEEIDKDYEDGIKSMQTICDNTLKIHNQNVENYNKERDRFYSDKLELVKEQNKFSCERADFYKSMKGSFLSRLKFLFNI